MPRVAAISVQNLSSRIKDQIKGLLGEALLATHYRPLVEAVYDFAVLELVHDYYLNDCESKRIDFLAYCCSPQGLGRILKSPLKPQIQSLANFIGTKESFWRERIGATEFQIVGDLHAPITKIRVGDYVYYENFLKVEVFLQNVLREINPTFSALVPHFEIYDDYIKRKFIEFDDRNFTPKDYYYNFGVLLSLALYLRMADLHMENVVFNNNSAKIIDFEFMLVPDYDHLEYGLRPTHLVDHIGVDNISALYGGYRMIYSYTKPILLLKNKFCPEIAWKVPSKRKVFNIPSPGKFKKSLPHRHAKELSVGFNFGMEELIRNKPKIIECALSTKFFVRQLVRPTVQYRYLIAGYGYPQINKSYNLSSYYDVVFKNNPWKDFFTPKPKVLKNLEVRDCESHLIPYFYSDVGSKNVFHSSGTVVGYLRESPLNEFLKFVSDDEAYRVFAKKQLALTKRYITLNSRRRFE